LQTADLSSTRTILSKIAQRSPTEMTNYSMAIDLKNTSIHLYHKTDFSNAYIISLKAELQKGKHHENIIGYFPKNIANVLEKTIRKKGIETAISQYKFLRQNATKKYDFQNNDAINFAIELINKGNVKDAITLLECLKTFDSDKTLICTWLGVAYRMENKIEESKINFEKTLAKNPNDYLANLFGKQENQKVSFKLNGFDHAQKVYIIGAFSNWYKNPIEMKRENGLWIYETVLPKGENLYKFIIDDNRTIDYENRLFVSTKEYLRSRLFVW
jgi:tetratricopeptide (TPR) repeat protein